MNVLNLFRLAKAGLLFAFLSGSPLFAGDGFLNIVTHQVDWLGLPDRSDHWDGSRENQIETTAMEILASRGDIIALQEIVMDPVNGNAFTDLLARLREEDPDSDWQGTASPRFTYWWTPDYTNDPAARPAYLWRGSRIAFDDARPILKWIPEGDPRFASGRLPFLMIVRVRTRSAWQPLLLANVHLGTESAARRKESMTALLADMRDQFASVPLVILGQFNLEAAGGANGEIADWGTYLDADHSGQSDFTHAAGSIADRADSDHTHILINEALLPSYLGVPEAHRRAVLPSRVSSHPAVRTRLFLEPYFPDDGRFDIATFNLEWLGYPANSGEWWGSRESQIEAAAEEIIALKADLIALQEIIVDSLNGDALAALVSALNDLDAEDSWAGAYNPKFSYWWNPDFNDYPAQRQAYIWRQSCVRVNRSAALLNDLPAGDDRFGSGRLPYLLQVEVGAGAIRTPLNLINLHLKCCSGHATRRAASMALLLDYLHQNHANDPFVVLGDLNVADRGGSNGEIAEWGAYDDQDRDGEPDFFHAAGTPDPDAWGNIDHILLSDELAGAYDLVPANLRNRKRVSFVSDHDPVLTSLSSQPSAEDLAEAEEAEASTGIRIEIEARLGDTNRNGRADNGETVEYRIVHSPDAATDAGTRLLSSGSYTITLAPDGGAPSLTKIHCRTLLSTDLLSWHAESGRFAEVVESPTRSTDGITFSLRETVPAESTFLRIEVREAP